jgi:hypothetical protein
MRDAETYRKFAQECRRMAHTASAGDRAVLLQIAEAWEEQANQAAKLSGKKDGSEWHAVPGDTK